jgi:hypothetical protein
MLVELVRRRLLLGGRRAGLEGQQHPAGHHDKAESDHQHRSGAQRNAHRQAPPGKSM